jgi:hypothetical protein
VDCEVTTIQWAFGLDKTRHPACWDLTESGTVKRDPDPIDLLLEAFDDLVTVPGPDYERLRTGRNRPLSTRGSGGAGCRLGSRLLFGAEFRDSELVFVEADDFAQVLD